MTIQTMETPAYVIDLEKLVKNLECLKNVADQSGCKILLAQKCFSMFSLYPLIGTYLAGTTASGLYEAKLGREEMNLENHVYAAAYREEEMPEILEICDHIVFNSFTQWETYKPLAMKYPKEYGIRVNPQCSTQSGHAIYDPCAPFSRMGVTIENFRGDMLDGLSGLHFHTLCEQNVDALETTLEVFERDFGRYLHNLKWLNLGGGHHITRDDYQVERLISLIQRLKETYNIEIYIEPGEAVALNAGYLVSSVLDIVDNGMKIAILDTSAACHMPDVLEMPYRPEIFGAKEKGELPHTYRLAGPTCLAGDVIGDYSFENEQKIGDRVVFKDMAIYSMVKNNTFNGMKLPSIAILEGENVKIVKGFGYDDFKMRLS